MGRTNPLHHQFWTVLLALAAVAFWVVGVGAGWRGWLLVDDDGVGRGIVAHAQAFGIEAAVWWIPAAVLTLTTWVVSFGVVLVDLIRGRSPALIPPVPPTPTSGSPAEEDMEASGADTPDSASSATGEGRRPV